MSRIALALGVASLPLLGCSGPSRAPIETVGEATVLSGIVSEAEGSAAVEVGEECQLHLQRTNDPLFNCRVRVVCGDETLYGLPGAGFNRCREDEAGRLDAAVDGYRTRVDGDPSMRYELSERKVVVADTAPDFKVVVLLAAW